MSASSLNRNPLESILAAAKAHGYKIICTLHYQSNDENPNVLPTVNLNVEFAEDRIDLIQKLLA
jgi:hypothetical protein